MSAPAKKAAPPAKAKKKAKVQAAAASVGGNGEPKTSKQAQVIALMSRAGGATAPEILAFTGWQEHTLRGFVAGALRVKLGLAVESTKVDGNRVYSIL